MSQRTKIFLKNTLKILVPLAVGIFILLQLYSKENIEQVIDTLKNETKYEWLALSLVLCAAGHVVRAVRWRQLLTPLDASPRYGNLIYSVFVNYLVNNVIPRMGEVTRCAIVARYEKMSFSKIFGTLISERIIDLTSLGVVILLSFLLTTQDFVQLFAQNPDLTEKIISWFSSVWLYVGIAGFVLACVLIYKRFKYTRIMQRITGAVKNMATGVKSISKLENKHRIFNLTLLLWLVYFLEFYVCVFAFPFSEHLTPQQGLFIFVVANVGIVVPVQGGVGPWHAAVQFSMPLFGILVPKALIFALIVHGVQWMMINLLGIVGLIALPLTNKRSEKIQNS
ncbi:MAG: flippase-like domain-containing protein [Bacteroidales bacterium]|jgi:uncharacterized protein (TIRG00374 family)|nr:flippase-like domain-containing protein [Bacteroidales bacterium]